MDRWSLEDLTSSTKGYCRLLLDGLDIGIDVFPFRKGADPATIKSKATAIVEVLNAADHWRSGPRDGSGPERLEDAVDSLHFMNEAHEAMTS